MRATFFICKYIDDENMINGAWGLVVSTSTCVSNRDQNK